MPAAFHYTGKSKTPIPTGAPLRAAGRKVGWTPEAPRQHRAHSPPPSSGSSAGRASPTWPRLGRCSDSSSAEADPLAGRWTKTLLVGSGEVPDPPSPPASSPPRGDSRAPLALGRGTGTHATTSGWEAPHPGAPRQTGPGSGCRRSGPKSPHMYDLPFPHVHKRPHAAHSGPLR